MSCPRKQTKPKQSNPAKENIHHSPDKITKCGGNYAAPQGTSCSQLGGAGQWIAIWGAEAEGTTGLSRPLFAFTLKAGPGAAVGPRHPASSAPRTPPPPRLPPAPPRSTHIPGCWRQLLPEGFPVFKDTDFVFYRPVSGLRANLGRRPIYPIFLVFLLRPLGTWRKSTTPFEGKSADEMIQSQLTGFERLSLG